MLIHPGKSFLLVIDVQERLLPAIHEGERVLESCAWLVRAAQKIGIPVAATEHYPEGLGRLHATLLGLLPSGAVVAKNWFSCVAAQCLPGLPGSDREQAVLIGMETHVCLMQTALALKGEGRDVYVVADCVGSRRIEDRDLALARMRAEGIRIVSREMVVFEWLQRGDTPLFKEVVREFLR
jgi:nicotinamidase-related amidase